MTSSGFDSADADADSAGPGVYELFKKGVGILLAAAVGFHILQVLREGGVYNATAPKNMEQVQKAVVRTLASRQDPKDFVEKAKEAVQRRGRLAGEYLADAVDGTLERVDHHKGLAKGRLKPDEGEMFRMSEKIRPAMEEWPQAMVFSTSAAEEKTALWIPDYAYEVLSGSREDPELLFRHYATVLFERGWLLSNGLFDPETGRGMIHAGREELVVRVVVAKREVFPGYPVFIHSAVGDQSKDPDDGWGEEDF